MGKRSRTPRSGSPGRDRPSGLRERVARAADAAEKMRDERPLAPWDPFPLVELVIFTGMVSLITGVLVKGSIGSVLVIMGLALASMGGLENSIREHFSGYRSHSALLAGAVAIVALVLTTVVLRDSFGPLERLALVIVVTGVSYTVLRKSFIRRSGGKKAF